VEYRNKRLHALAVCVRDWIQGGLAIARNMTGKLKY